MPGPVAEQLDRSSGSRNQTLGSEDGSSAGSVVASVVYMEAAPFPPTHREGPTLQRGAGSAKVTNDEAAGSGAAPEAEAEEGASPGGVRPLPRGTARTPSLSLLQREPSRLQAGGFSGASQGSRHRPGQAQVRPQGPAGGERHLRAPRARAREGGQRGVTGEGQGGEDPGRGGAGGGKRGLAPGFRSAGSPPDSQPHTERPLQRGPPPPRPGSPTPLTWLGCSACSEDAIFLRPD